MGVIHLKKSTEDITISIEKVISVVAVFSIVGDGLFSFLKMHSQPLLK